MCCLILFYSNRMNRSDAEEMISIIQDQVSQLDHKIYITPVGGYRFILNTDNIF